MGLRERGRGGGGSRYRAADAPSRWKWAALLLALFSISGSAIWLYLKSNAALVRTDPSTLCPIERPPAALMVVLLDLSDALTEPQRVEVLNRLQRMRKALPQFGLLHVYAVADPSGPLLRPLVEVCSPGTGEGLNRMYQNPDLARRRWDSFAQKLDDSLSRLLLRPEAASSPIFEAVQSIGLRSFGRPEFDQVSDRRLILVSDLMQNVPGELSLYGGVPTDPGFWTSRYFSSVQTDLAGVRVEIWYLNRPSSAARWPALPQFWNTYFLKQDAVVDLVDPIHGAQ